mmetsp:Transcript_2384/g.4124  ORF Transcript_2384/g.4124 Transcript_2384/m.4124 type:complete len:151 (-) Transcript_2384:583-1035(-)
MRVRERDVRASKHRRGGYRYSSREEPSLVVQLFTKARRFGEEVPWKEIITPLLVGRIAVLCAVSLLMVGQVKRDLGLSSAIELMLIGMGVIALPSAIPWLVEHIRGSGRGSDVSYQDEEGGRRPGRQEPDQEDDVLSSTSEEDSDFLSDV